MSKQAQADREITSVTDTRHGADEGKAVFGDRTEARLPRFDRRRGERRRLRATRAHPHQLQRRQDRPAAARRSRSHTPTWCHRPGEITQGSGFRRPPRGTRGTVPRPEWPHPFQTLKLQRSLSDVAAELAQRGHLNEQGRPFSAASVRSMPRPHDYLPTYAAMRSSEEWIEPTGTIDEGWLEHMLRRDEELAQRLVITPTPPLVVGRCSQPSHVSEGSGQRVQVPI
jgi:hypothetical protein